jgi:hypothetical protein
MTEDLLRVLSLYGYISAIQDYLRFKIAKVEKLVDTENADTMNLGDGHYIYLIAYDYYDKPYLVIKIFSKDDYILNRLNQIIDALKIIVEKSISKH